MSQWKQALQSHHLSNESSIQYDLPATCKWIKTDSQSKFIDKHSYYDEYGMLSLKPKTRKLLYKVTDDAEIWSVGLRHSSFLLVVEDDRIKISFSNFRSNKTLMSATIRIVNGTPRGYWFDRRGNASHKVRWLKSRDLYQLIANGMDRGNEDGNEQSDARHTYRYICAFFAQVAIALEHMLKKQMHPSDWELVPRIKPEFNTPNSCGVLTGSPLNNHGASNLVDDWDVSDTLSYWQSTLRLINIHIENMYTVLMHPCVHYGTSVDVYGGAYKAFRSRNLSELSMALLGSSGKGSRRVILDWFEHRDEYSLPWYDVSNHWSGASKVNRVLDNDIPALPSEGIDLAMPGKTPRINVVNANDYKVISSDVVMALINLRKHFSLNETLGLAKVDWHQCVTTPRVSLRDYPELCMLVGKHVSAEKFKRMVNAHVLPNTHWREDNLDDIPRLIRSASERSIARLISPPKGINTFNDWHDYLSFIVNSSTEKDYQLPVNKDFEKFDGTVLPSGLRVVFPRRDTDLRRWGAGQSHCIGGYGRLILTNNSVIFCLYDGDIPMWCAQLTSGISLNSHWRIAQFRGSYNKRASDDLYDEVEKHLSLKTTKYDSQPRQPHYKYFTEDGVDELDIIQRDAVYHVKNNVGERANDLPF